MSGDRCVRATLRKKEILRGKENFQSAFSSGRRIESPLVVGLLVQRPLTSTDRYQGNRVGFVVRRTVRRAVDRNRIKRLLREAYRKNKNGESFSGHNTRTPHDIILMYSPKTSRSVHSVTYQEIEECVKKILSTVK